MRSFFHFIALLFRRWTWLMAWRDSRRSRRKLLLYASSIVLGVAALTAIASFGRQMERAVQAQSKTLLGADMVVTTRDPFTATQDLFLAQLGAERSRETAFGSMAMFPKSGDTRLVQVRALEGGFPFFGRIETEPAGAEQIFRRGEGALVERSLMDLYQAEPGDPVKIGDITLPIAGALTAVPGETVAMGSIAPRIFIPMAQLEGSGLLGEGSLVNHKAYLRFPETVDVEALAAEREGQFRARGLRFDTVGERQRELGRGLGHMLRFLNLAGFVALLLGGVGVASGIHVHMKQKLAAVATLRCLGTPVPQAFAIYFAQAMAVALIGSVAGALLGIVAQAFLQAAVADFLPFDLPPAVSLAAIWHGIWLGFLISVIFALLPLLPIRLVAPLAALRSAFSHEARAARDPLVWLVYALALGGLAAFGISQGRAWQEGLGYAGGIATAFLVLAGFGWALGRLARLVVSPSWPFALRQGIANLHRPNNRTVLLMQALGMGVFLILTMALVQHSLIGQLAPLHDGSQGNTVLFDIQSDQREGVLGILAEQDLPLLQEAPMISMRLHSVKGVPVRELRKQSRRHGGRMLTREYRSTYRSEIAPTEKLIAGEWHARAESLDEPIPVSVERDMSERLGISPGDDLVFDVQGIQVPCVVASIREVDWRRLSPNFFVVFPAGAIEVAPAVHAVVTRIGNSEQSARLQREVVRRFPNVSAIDLTLVLDTIDRIVGKISHVIRFMAAFTAGTGLLVLVGSIASGRRQRLQESILLRTLGATRRQVLRILAAEYAALGTLAALNGIALANLAAWALCRRVFETPFVPAWGAMAAAFGAVLAVTLLAGLLGNRRLLDRPPLEVLRAEA